MFGDVEAIKPGLVGGLRKFYALVELGGEGAI
jgi:hypothetical protein